MISLPLLVPSPMLPDLLALSDWMPFMNKVADVLCCLNWIYIEIVGLGLECGIVQIGRLTVSDILIRSLIMRSGFPSMWH
jgi:hypothetical protein